MRAQLSAHPAGKAEVSRIPDHILADGRDGEYRDTILVAEIHELGHVLDRLGFILPADEDLNGQGTNVESSRIFHVHGPLLIRQFLQDARAATGPQDDGLRERGGDDSAQDARLLQRHQARVAGVRPGPRVVQSTRRKAPGPPGGSASSAAGAKSTTAGKPRRERWASVEATSTVSSAMSSATGPFARAAPP